MTDWITNICLISLGIYGAYRMVKWIGKKKNKEKFDKEVREIKRGIGTIKNTLIKEKEVKQNNAMKGGKQK
jgi:hypothetical protein